MKRTLLVFLFMLGPGVTRGEDQVYFPDPNLKSAVEKELWGVTDPTPSDMLLLTSLTAMWDGITDLTGLEYATNLQKLVLRGNHIQDASLLAALPQLETLNLSMNRLPNLSSLSGLTGLRDLDLHNNLNLSDISGLAGLTNLERVVLREMNISNLSPLAGLSHLRELDLCDNYVSDISPLRSLHSLERLDLRGNALDVTSLRVYIYEIQQNNPGVSILYDESGQSGQPSGCSVTLSSGVGGAVTTPAEGRLQYTCGQTLWLTATADPGFVFTHWSGSLFSGANPVRLTASTNMAIQANFLSILDLVHVDDDAFGDPGPQDPGRSDPQENGTSAHPFDSLQEAIAVSPDGAAILVHAGTYRENIDLQGKSLHLLGRSPEAPAGSPWPVLEGVDTGPVVHLSGANAQSSLAGLVITRATGLLAAAILCDGTAVSLSNCLIVGTRSIDPNGAALYCTDSQVGLTNCTLADNSGGPRSAAITLVNSDLAVVNSILWNDTPVEVLSLGTSRPEVDYSAIRGGWPEIGNIQSEPLFAQRGRWVNPEDPRESLKPNDRLALWILGDYHLQSQAGRWDPATRTWVQDNVTSPCIDGGDWAASVRYEPIPNGRTIDMGAYGGTTEASKSFIPAGSP